MIRIFALKSKVDKAAFAELEKLNHTQKEELKKQQEKITSLVADNQKQVVSFEDQA